MESLEYITLSPGELGKLLSAGNGDAALLYLYLRSTGDTALTHAAERLHLDRQALGWAQTLLKQLGLLDIRHPERRYDKSQAPNYTGEAVTAFAAKDPAFRLLQGEVSRRLGRVLTTEELKTLLAIRDYLKLPPEVVSMALTYCLQRNEYRNRSRGENRTITLRAVEQECYAWANRGITTLEAASDYISRNLQQMAPEARIKRVLGIDRALVDSERDYIRQWIGWGFGPEAVQIAYEKTVLSTNKLTWRYLHRILERWHEKGLHTPEEIRRGDGKAQSAPPAQDGFVMGQEELEAIARLKARRDSGKEG